MAATEYVTALSTKITHPSGLIFEITPSDTEELKYVTREIHCAGQGGDIMVYGTEHKATGDPATTMKIEAGQTITVRLTQVLATGTTATGLRGLA